nr:ABC transporter ATP-binding protein [Candidatus Sigynarchaeota archaeon]
MIEFNSVSYQYPDGALALNNVSLRIKDGAFVAILGKNGAGKTTFVKCINGLIKPTKGSVIVDHLNTRNESVAQMAKRVGLVFQNSDNQLFASSVKDELDFSLKNVGIPETEREETIDETLRTLNLTGFKEKSPFLLSGGERKRVAFASLICMDQNIFIADEPTQGQDEIQRKNIELLLQKMQEKRKTVIVITHDVDFITRLATRVLIFDEGRIMIDGSVDDMFKSSRVLDLIHVQPTQELMLKWLLQEKGITASRPFSLDQEALVATIVDKIKVKKVNVN